MAELTAPDVRRALDLPDSAVSWLGAAADATGPSLQLPSDSEADALLDRLHVRSEDRSEVLAARPDPAAHPALWWVLERAYWELLATMGGIEMLWWPQLAEAKPESVGRCGYVWVFLAGVPAVRRYHADRGIPDEVSWASLSDLGQQLSVHRRIFGTGGLHTQWWLTLAFRGALYELGRLQFNRDMIRFDDAPAPAAVRTPQRGDRAAGLHIPERGPMDPTACEDSIRWAREFFPRHFADEGPVRYGTCVSWLLDEQLTEYLPGDTNIMRFLQRFHLVPQPEEEPQAWTAGDKAIVEFVFRRLHPGPDYPSEMVGQLPTDSTLRRAIVSHLRSGRHWRVRTGWFGLETLDGSVI